MYEKLPFDITVHSVYTGNTTGCRQTSLSQVRSNSSAAAQYKLFFFFLLELWEELSAAVWLSCTKGMMCPSMRGKSCIYVSMKGGAHLP